MAMISRMMSRMEVVFIARLALADEVGVLGDQAAIHHQEDAQRLDQRLHLRAGSPCENGWPPMRLVVASMRTKETFSGPALSMAAFKPAEIHVALERAVLSVFRASGPVKFQHLAAGQVEVRLGGGEVIVHGHDVAGLDEGLGQQVLGGAPLVGRQDVLVAENLGDGIFQP